MSVSIGGASGLIGGLPLGLSGEECVLRKVMVFGVTMNHHENFGQQRGK